MVRVVQVNRDCARLPDPALSLVMINPNGLAARCSSFGGRESSMALALDFSDEARECFRPSSE